MLPSLRSDVLYSQVPALGAGDRGMLDLLMLDHQGRLTGIELKADEDLHLPLQALDYWIRVRVLNADRHRTAAGDRPFSASSGKDIFRAAKSLHSRRACSWLRRRYAFTPQIFRSCAIFRRRSNGNS